MSITVPDSVVYISPKAFYDKDYLLTVRLGKGITEICKSMFANSNELQKVYITNSITKIDSYAFANSNKMTDLYYDGTIEQWNAIEKADLCMPHDMTIHCSDGELEHKAES